MIFLLFYGKIAFEAYFMQFPFLLRNLDNSLINKNVSLLLFNFLNRFWKTFLLTSSTPINLTQSNLWYVNYSNTGHLGHVCDG